jgi:Tfp pilus assembly protein PilF
VDLWNNLANALRNGVRAEEAIEAYRRAAELAPASGVVLNNPGEHVE